MKYPIIIISSLILILANCQPSSAQSPIVGNPSDFYAPEATFFNPASGVMIMDRLSVGIRTMHWGMNDAGWQLREQTIGYSPPPNWRGASIIAHSFNSLMMSQLWLRLQYSKKLYRWFSVGGGIGIINRSWDMDSFDLDQVDDPLFRSGSSAIAPDITVGCLLFPTPTIRFGLSIHQINRPDVSLGSSGIRLPAIMSAGVTWDLSTVRLQLAAIGVEFHGTSSESLKRIIDDRLYELQAGAEATLFQRGKLKLLWSNRSMSFDIQFNLFQSYQFIYRFSRPLGQFGLYGKESHLFGFILDFEHLPLMPRMHSLPKLPQLQINNSYQTISSPELLSAISKVDSVHITHRSVKRILDQSMSTEALEAISQSLRLIDRTSTNQPMEALSSTTGGQNKGLNGSYSRDYVGSLEYVGHLLKRSSVDVELILPSGEEQRARGLSNVMTEKGVLNRDNTVSLYRVPIANSSDSSTVGDRIKQMSTDENLISVSPDSLKIDIITTLQTNRYNGWDIGVYSDSDSLIHKWSGDQKIPDQVVWDLKDGDDNFISPGNYYYYISCTDNNGDLLSSSKQYIRAFHSRIVQSFEITQKPKNLNRGIEKVKLILGTDNTKD